MNAKRTAGESAADGETGQPTSRRSDRPTSSNTGFIVGHSPTSSVLLDVDEKLLPPILAGRFTPVAAEQVRQFYTAVAEIFERWVARRSSRHTQRAYRQDFMAFVRFMKIKWPEHSPTLFTISVADLQAWRDLLAETSAPKTINRRISSVSSFYKYLQASAAELRLPITVPNPAHAQFISRASTDPVDETKALSATRARQLIGLPQGDDVIAYRDRAILRFYLYSAARVSTGCRLIVSDFHRDGDEATIRLNEKGDHRRTIGLHFAAAEAIAEYLRVAGITRGPIFRPRSGPRSKALAPRHLTPTAMYHIVMGYLQQLPGSSEESTEDGRTIRRCVYTPHSIRATTATILLDSGVDITKVQQLLGHRHITTTQIYDKRRRGTSESASHDVPI